MCQSTVFEVGVDLVDNCMTVMSFVRGGGIQSAGCEKRGEPTGVEQGRLPGISFSSSSGIRRTTSCPVVRLALFTGGERGEVNFGNLSRRDPRFGFLVLNGIRVFDGLASVVVDRCDGTFHDFVHPSGTGGLHATTTRGHCCRGRDERSQTLYPSRVESRSLCRNFRCKAPRGLGNNEGRDRPTAARWSRRTASLRHLGLFGIARAERSGRPSHSRAMGSAGLGRVEHDFASAPGEYSAGDRLVETGPADDVLEISDLGVASSQSPSTHRDSGITRLNTPMNNSGLSMPTWRSS